MNIPNLRRNQGTDVFVYSEFLFGKGKQQAIFFVDIFFEEEVKELQNKVSLNCIYIKKKLLSIYIMQIFI